MREIRQSGSEGGATLKTWSLPLSIVLSLRDAIADISQQLPTRSLGPLPVTNIGLELTPKCGKYRHSATPELL
jgi:hypothetical protein